MTLKELSKTFTILKIEETNVKGILTIFARKNKGVKVWMGNIVNGKLFNFEASSAEWNKEKNQLDISL